MSESGSWNWNSYSQPRPNFEFSGHFPVLRRAAFLIQTLSVFAERKKSLEDAEVSLQNLLQMDLSVAKRHDVLISLVRRILCDDDSIDFR